jgi:hypothetical protein
MFRSLLGAKEAALMAEDQEIGAKDALAAELRASLDQRSREAELFEPIGCLVDLPPDNTALAPAQGVAVRSAACPRLFVHSSCCSRQAPRIRRLTSIA